MTVLSRRDFLKIMAVSSAGVATAAAKPFLQPFHTQSSDKPNILIFVFDAMSARHLSLYGYERGTTPNLAKFASHANVYHTHYSEANFTSPGTATLLSGLHPWNHRAINLGGLVRRDLLDHNIFRYLGDDYLKIAFTQNTWADLLLRQYETDLDIHFPTTSFAYKMRRPEFSISAFASSDPLGTYYAYDDFLSFSPKEFNPLPGSLLLGSLGLFNEQSSVRLGKPSKEYPFGIPTNELFFYFYNDEVFAGVSEIVRNLTSPLNPVFGYFHLFAPHGSYCPRKEFVDIFPDVNVPTKPCHPLSIMDLSPQKLYKYRKNYDEYIANVDDEFGKLMDSFEKTGILDTSYVVITSDHGEIFERGEFGHGTLLLYEPVLRIPLLISSPGQKERLDVHSPTSSVDVLPTLLAIAGKDIPAGLDGRVLPGFGGSEDFQRSIFALEAKENSAFQPLKTATITLIKEGQKLIYYADYSDYRDVFELYDLNNDIEEMTDLFSRDTLTASRMKEELLDMLEAANRSFNNN